MDDAHAAAAAAQGGFDDDGIADFFGDAFCASSGDLTGSSVPGKNGDTGVMQRGLRAAVLSPRSSRSSAWGRRR